MKLLIKVGEGCIASRAAFMLWKDNEIPTTPSIELNMQVDPDIPSGHVKVYNEEVKPAVELAFVKDEAGAVMIMSGGESNESVSAVEYSSKQAILADWLVSIESLGAKEMFEKLNRHLVYRTYILNTHKVSAADVMVWARAKKDDKLAKCLSAPMETNDVFRFAKRWYKAMDSIKILQQAVGITRSSQVNSQWDDVMKLVKSQGSFDVNLPGLEYGKVVTRFPPEPSGYLHIGHAKAALLNDFFARYYGGKLVLRFDDTNPMKEKLEFEQNIIQDLGRLGIKPDVCEYASDYFDRLLVYARQFILDGLAYVDMTPVELLREQRTRKEANEYRAQSIERNLELWENEMVKATELGQKCVLRAKIDITNNNGALRDPIMYRFCIDPPHHRTGTKYKMYPSYDFSCPIIDSLEGVTHALRSAEYSDREAQYYWFADAAKVRKPVMWDFARLNFMYTVMSKRKLTWFVEQKYVEGWNDPRFPTVQGIRRRGLTIQALRAFILSQGASKNSTFMEWDKIWAVNKRVIDPVAPRFTGIDAAKHVKATVWINGSLVTLEKAEVPRHKKNPDVGTKFLIRSPTIIMEQEDADSVDMGEIITMMDWGNMKVTSKNADGLVLEFLPENTDYKKTKKFTWLPWLDKQEQEKVEGGYESAHHLTKLTLVKYGHLVTKAKIEEDDDIEQIRNMESKIETAAFGDFNLKGLKKDDTIQLERRGYFICDAVHDDAVHGKALVLIEIPDGKGR